jgi:hypothetical protein
MKQLPMTPELAALINKAVGPDVDTSKLAVFETIALNTKPLPGKRGSLFEGAKAAPITLVDMVNYVNDGNHLPLMVDHSMAGAPTGRFFHAGLNYADDGLEMRSLFYLNTETQAQTISDLDAGVYDEVSVQFLSKEFNCSTCGWDFMDGTQANLSTRTCENGHTIGTDGVHADLINLDQFIELSLVARGAADKPKIVGHSESKLAPETALRLSAKGFEPDEFVVYASIGKADNMDTAKLISDYAAETSKVAVLTHEKTALTTQVGTLTADLSARDTTIADLQTQLAAAKAEKPEGFETITAEHAEAVAVLQEQVNGLLVATGQPKLEGEALPSKVAELKAKVTELTANLTAILPAPGGKSQGAGGDSKTVSPVLAAAFSVRK